MSSPPSSPPLVWITQGKTQHAAQLLEDSANGKRRVRWLASKKEDWLEGDVVIDQKLTPRRRWHPIPQCVSSPPNSRKRQCTKEAVTQTAATGARRISFGDPTASPLGGGNTDGGKLATDNGEPENCPDQSDITQDVDDDSSIEVLFTMLPPSPKKKPPNKSKPPLEVEMHPTCDTNDDKSKEYASCFNGGPSSILDHQAVGEASTDTSPNIDTNGSSEDSLERDQTTASLNDRKMPALKNSPLQKTAQSPLPEYQKETSSATNETQHYSYLTSAYVQNLAEICHTITYDRRWRVDPDQQSLLSWQCGDDLSAVIPLARRYRPWPKAKKTPVCHGLLCRCQQDSNETSTTGNGMRESVELETAASEDLAVSGDESNPHKNNAYSQLQTVDGNEESSAAHGAEIRSEADAAEDRCLHLYSRLFYRKGPWFRIDDAYCRYYAPKQQDQSPTLKPASGVANPGPAEPNQGRNNRQSSRNQKHTPAKKHDFFNRKPAASTKKPLAGTTGITSSLINEKLFQQHMEALEIFLRDLIRLKEMGLIRSFFNEEECGKTVGTARVLLTAEERRQVLAKLGGARRKSTGTAVQQRRPSMVESTSRRDSFSSSASVVENEIWNQMCRQKSISAQFTTTKGTKVLLPVSKKVNQVLFEKLAARIVQACSPADYVAAPVMKTRKASIKDTIAKVLSSLTSKSEQPMRNTTSGQQLETILGKFGMCIRLREAPMKSLQRAARLILCATSGPGQMRSEGGSNGWKSIRELDRNIVMENTQLKDAHYASNVEPPGAHSWHTVTYPGLRHRFGLASFCFQEAFEPLPLRSDSDGLDGPGEPHLEQVFPSRNAFLCWEVCAELRANADYLIEVNELLLYNERKRVRESGSSGKESTESAVDDDSKPKGQQHREKATGDSTMDFLGLLTPSKRKEMVKTFVAPSNVADIEKICEQMELDVSQLFATVEGQRRHPMKTECEEILCVMAVLILNVLLFRIKTVAEAEVLVAVVRPWLRHLSWEAGIAYILWDVIQILEKRGFYAICLQSLELLVFGNTRSSNDICEAIIEGSYCQLRPPGDTKLTVAFAHFLLSRRARGKALDRIVIDSSHIKRIVEKSKHTQHGKGKKGKKPASVVPKFVAALAREALNDVVQPAAVAFSSIRTLARRLNQPLFKCLQPLPSREAQELGIRFGNEQSATVADPKKYSDWCPSTDYAVANSIAIEESMVGRRCSFVGHEDDQEKAGFTASLNVEQLAMEFYASGRLPECEESNECLKGGWVGWHDEGGLVRALFRNLTFDVLGMDWKCCANDISGEHQSTIHLSPYQGAPFDLHVGFELAEVLSTNDREIQPNRGFYLRRKERIDAFLKHLSNLSRQEVSDLVWNSIAARRKYMVEASRKDPWIEKDTLQCRTLSLVAAGFGGQMIAAFLKMLFFDYRHYSGGLPDLLLVRARHASANSLVDLGEWVGESFDKQFLAELEAQQRASLLGDRDDDFLGCSKVGDSGGGGGGSRNRSNRGRQQVRNKDASGKRTVDIPELPPKLQLMHDDSEVEVECMFVEVKSSNDRLDARQEDWLNVLDRFGNARVCKFSDGKGRKKAKTQGKGTPAAAAAAAEGKS